MTAEGGDTVAQPAETRSGGGEGSLKLALIVGGIAAVVKLVAAKKAEWQGLTESQVREKLDSRLPGRMPDEKRAAVADKVVSKMRERGVLREQNEATAPTTAEKGGTAAEPDSADATAGDDSEDTLPTREHGRDVPETH